MTRLYVPQPLTEDTLLVLPAEGARHVVQVLRLRLGESLTLFNGDGGEFDALLEVIGRREVIVRVLGHRPIEAESPVDMTLVQCVSKGERMDFAVQKAVELGVRRIAPVLSERCPVNLDIERWRKKWNHWRRVIVSACEQCGRNQLPELAPVQPLEHWLERGGGLRLVLTPGYGGSLRGLKPAEAVTLIVGPEGGLTQLEVDLAQRCGYVAVDLGPRILRTETAGIAALAAIQVLWGG